ncbi:MAG: segregation/condensation protein A [candidate division WOR-3 bacterium]
MTVPPVRLEIFEGPVELLLYLVRTSELDVTDVPIAQLTDDFLAWVRAASMLNMEAAADFLVMAAVLLRLKVRQLLPRVPTEDLDTPSVSLEQILDEFRRFQQAARVLSERESVRRQMFPRPGETPRARPAESEDLLLLTSALQRVLARLEPGPVVRLAPLRLRLEDRIAALRELVRARGAIDFDEAVSGQTVAEVIVMFLAVLELVRLGELRVRQEAEFGTIRLELKAPAGEPVPALCAGP